MEGPGPRWAGAGWPVHDAVSSLVVRGVLSGPVRARPASAARVRLGPGPRNRPIQAPCADRGPQGYGPLARTRSLGARRGRAPPGRKVD